MSNPIWAWKNNFRIADAILSASQSEISNPVENILNDVLGEFWSSQYETIHIDSKANKMDFVISGIGGNRDITIANGDYYPEEFWDIIANEVNDNITAGAGNANVSTTFDSTTGGTISRASGTINFLCASGANKRTSIYPLMGFACLADTGAVSTKTSDRVILSTGGTITITTASNDVFKYTDTGARTATMAGGTYTRMSILSEWKYQMDTASSVTDYDPHYLETSLHYKVSKGSGTFSIDSTGNTFMDVVGMVAAGAASSHEATEVRIHTEEWIKIDTQMTTPTYAMLLVAMFGHNFTSDAVVRFQNHASDSWAAPTVNELMTWNVKNLVKLITSTQLRWIRILIQDRENPAGYVSLAAVLAGDYTESSEDTFSLKRTYEQKLIESRNETLEGHVFGQITSERDGTGAKFHFIDQNTKDSLEELTSYAGTTKAFVWIWDSDSNLNANTEWAYMDRTLTFEKEETPEEDLYATNDFMIRSAAA